MRENFTVVSKHGHSAKTNREEREIGVEVDFNVAATKQREKILLFASQTLCSMFEGWKERRKNMREHMIISFFFTRASHGSNKAR